MGYTQQEFAEESGIGHSSLKKYISGENAYNYEVLDILATKLDCSYDYLLGKSDSLHYEFHEVAKLTKLSEDAIRCIAKHAEISDNNFNSKMYIWVLNEMIKRNSLMVVIQAYLTSLQPMDKPKQEVERQMTKKMKEKLNTDVDVEEVSPLNLETTVLIALISELKNLKHEKSAEILDIMREYNKYPTQDTMTKIGEIFNQI